MATKYSNESASDPGVQDVLDPDQIRFWIQDCEEKHGERCNNTEHQSATPVTELRFIDLVDGCIVKAPPKARYFALSYMWGGVSQMLLTTENCAEMSLPGSLQLNSGTIPAVIQDAITFVIAVGERYLWVDSLCIVQNSIDIKHSQILQMGTIYNGAVACLVGAVGTDANSGLAGVRPNTRTPETRKLQYEAVYLIDPGPDEYISLRKPRDNTPFVRLRNQVKARQLDLNNRLITSEYSSRAWTYQERLLSRRCIYFMENMVYFSCRSAIRGENKTTPYSQNAQDIRSLSLFKADPIFSGDPLQYHRTLGAIYAGIVTEYTRKKLTFSHDVLNAFAGIGAAVGKLASWKLVAGLPEGILDYALLWTPTKSSERRSDVSQAVFPSWSWTGWHSEADYEMILRTESGFEPYFASLRSLIYQARIYDQGELRTIKTLVPVNEELAGNARRFLNAQNLRRLDSVEHSLAQRGALVFEALTMPFKDFAIYSAEEKGLQSTVIMRPGTSQIYLTNITVHLDIRLFCSSSELSIDSPIDNYDIVLLSEIKDLGEELISWETRKHKLNIMLVKWTGIFAERIAIGKLLGEVPRTDENGDYWAIEAKSRNFGKCRWKTIQLV